MDSPFFHTQKTGYLLGVNQDWWIHWRWARVLRAFTHVHPRAEVNPHSSSKNSQLRQPCHLALCHALIDRVESANEDRHRISVSFSCPIIYAMTWLSQVITYGMVNGSVMNLLVWLGPIFTLPTPNSTWNTRSYLDMTSIHSSPGGIGNAKHHVWASKPCQCPIAHPDTNRGYLSNCGCS
jgi:hypothetical protein